MFFQVSGTVKIESSVLPSGDLNLTLRIARIGEKLLHMRDRSLLYISDLHIPEIYTQPVSVRNYFTFARLEGVFINLVTRPELLVLIISIRDSELVKDIFIVEIRQLKSF